jgi:hypothetical protein
MYKNWGIRLLHSLRLLLSSSVFGRAGFAVFITSRDARITCAAQLPFRG